MGPGHIKTDNGALYWKNYINGALLMSKLYNFIL